MGSREPVRYRLFVDESGDFADRGDDVLAAGLLIRTDVRGSSPAEIRAALQRAFPGMPWPLHAAHLNRPVLVALARYALAGELPTRQDAERPSDLNRLADEVVRVLQPGYASFLEEALGALPHALPGIATLRTLDGALRSEAPGLYRVLESRVRHGWSLVERYVRSLVRAGEEVDSSGGAAVLAVICGESVRGEAAPAGEDGLQLESSRYLALLDGLLQRTADLLARRTASNEVRLQILTRDVRDATVEVRVPLHVRHAGAATRRLRLPGTGLRFVVESVCKYDDQAHAALVLADFLANRSRRRVDDPRASLDQVEGRVVRAVGAPVRSGDPGLSHLAATGWPSERVMAAFSVARGEAQVQVSAPGPHLRNWAREQAEQWAAVIEGAR